MPDLEDIIYSREGTIAAVTDYYVFLTRMYLKESHVVYPPAGGWPSIVNADPAELRSLGKSNEVLALMAHLPYIRYPFDMIGASEGTPEVTPGSTVADWSDLIPRLSPSRGARRESGDGLRILTEGRLADISPPHVFGLFRNRDEAWCSIQSSGSSTVKTVMAGSSSVAVAASKMSIGTWTTRCPSKRQTGDAVQLLNQS
ncbi:hypothetical protein C8A03DRAFT_38628, partial [Achaetomium macrosporum]